jgi:hypothetical protein
MPKRIRYSIEQDYVKVWFDGAVHAESIALLVTDIVSERAKLPDRLKVLVDSRRASFAGKPGDLKMILKKIKENYKKFEIIKLTIVLQNPYETAISIIMQEMLKDIANVYFKVFSTEQAAASWLK